jgi:hypothetical protein
LVFINSTQQSGALLRSMLWQQYHASPLSRFKGSDAFGQRKEAVQLGAKPISLLAALQYALLMVRV